MTIGLGRVQLRLVPWTRERKSVCLLAGHREQDEGGGERMDEKIDKVI